MKRMFFKATIFVPIGLIVGIFIRPLTLCIPQLGLFINTYSFNIFIVVATVLWLCCSPAKNSCGDGTWSELLFYLVPLEAVTMLVFAQWHFAIAVLLLVALLACVFLLLVSLRKDARKYAVTPKRKRMYKAMFRRGTMLVAAVICAVPCCLSLFVYDMKYPRYQAVQETWEELFSEAKDSQTEEDSTGDPYAEKTSLWNCFTEAQWKKWSVSEKVTIMQELVDFETEQLGIPTVPITAELLGSLLLGTYSDTTGEMEINIQALASAPVEECIQTACHEVYHAFQFYLIDTLDWENPAMHTAYFEELQSWMDNQKDYKDAVADGFDAYENQPVEVTAREYAKTESAKILTYIN